MKRENCFTENVKFIIRLFISAVSAGFMIGIGGTAYVACSERIVGALLFCFGLFTVCSFGLPLFTGNVGFLPAMGKKFQYLADLVVTWLGNLCGAVLCALLVKTAMPYIADNTVSLGFLREGDPAYKTMILSVLCGVMMLIAVSAYRNQANRCSWAIFLCVPLFLICGFEHSIADMFYYAVAGCSTLLYNMPHILLASIGNAIGAILTYICINVGRIFLTSYVPYEQIYSYRKQVIAEMKKMGATERELSLLHDITIRNSIINKREPRDVAWAMMQ